MLFQGTAKGDRYKLVRIDNVQDQPGFHGEGGFVIPEDEKAPVIQVGVHRFTVLFVKFPEVACKNILQSWFIPPDDQGRLVKPQFLVNGVPNLIFRIGLILDEGIVFPHNVRGAAVVFTLIGSERLKEFDHFPGSAEFQADVEIVFQIGLTVGSEYRET